MTKVLNGSVEVLKPNGVVGGSIPECETVSLLDGNLARWSSTSNVSKEERSGNQLKDESVEPSSTLFIKVGAPGTKTTPKLNTLKILHKKNMLK